MHQAKIDRVLCGSGESRQDVGENVRGDGVSPEVVGYRNLRNSLQKIHLELSVVAFISQLLIKVFKFTLWGNLCLNLDRGSVAV